MAKPHDERKADILATARGLFARRGYDQTSIQAIIDAVGIAKGTFYHYFTSAADLLETLTDGIATEATDEIQRVVEARGGSAIDKLNAFARATSQWKRENVEPARVMLFALYSDRNLVLRHKLEAKSVERARPVMQRLIDQGVREGSLTPVHPEHAAEVVLPWQTMVAEKGRQAGTLPAGERGERQGHRGVARCV